MDFITLAIQRYSERNFSDRKVESEKLELILESARIAPTAANKQPIKIISVQSDEALKKLGGSANIYDAPLALIVCADKNTSWERPFDKKKTTDIDASIITDHMMLEAEDIGLSSVWICYFKPDILRKDFNIPQNYEPINILAVGYSQKKNSQDHLNGRKALAEIVVEESF